MNAAVNCATATWPFGDAPGSQRIELPLHPDGPKLGPLTEMKHAAPTVPVAPAIPQPMLVIVTGPTLIFCDRAVGIANVETSATEARHAMFVADFMDDSLSGLASIAAFVL
jgi:hypothetical protein